MTEKNTRQIREAVLRRVAKIRQIIARIDFACAGTLLRRTKVCGKPGCRCAQDPRERHGPYYEWTRRHRSALLHRVVSAEQAQMIRMAIRNHRAILKLLHAWERETVRVIESLNCRKS